MRILILSLAIVFAACATRGEPVNETKVAEAAAGQATAEPEAQEVIEEVVEVDPDPDIVCVYESRTGTHLKEKRCYTREALEEAEDKSKEAFRTRGQRGTVYVPIHPEDPRSRKKSGK